MAKNFVKPGDQIGLVCPYATVSSGQGILVGQMFGIALYDGVLDDVVESAVVGVWDINALSTDVATQGQLAYWDNTNRRVTVTSSGNTLIGTFAEAKADAATTAYVKLQAINSAATPDIITSTVITVTTEELLALNTTPKALVAAPGAGKAIVPVDALMFLDYETTAYDGIAAGEDLAMRYTDGSGNIAAQVETTGFLDASADAHRAAVFSGLITPTANAALVLHMTSGNIATGDSPLKVQVRYRIVDLLT